MDDSQLESLAIKEIIEELERQKQIELKSRKPQERKIRPNSRFLGRTIVSVLQHNSRQNAEERRNSSKKLRELDRRPRSKSRSKERTRIRPTEYRNRTEQLDFYPDPEVAIEPMPVGINIDLATIFLSNFNKLLLNNTHDASKKQKKVKRKSKLLTIDLTKKKRKHSKKSRRTSMKSKRRRRIKKRNRRNSSSSSSVSSSSLSLSSDISLSTICDSNSESSSGEESGASTLLIDLT